MWMNRQMTRNNVPLSYLLGSVPFGSLKNELTVRPPVLLPRPETEDWATQVVSVLLNLSREQLDKVRIVDLCTGSGCIALLVADALRTRLGAAGEWKVVACDRSPIAVEIAQENAQKLGFEINQKQSNLHIVQADIFEDGDMDRLAVIAGGPFGLIVSNPPYIPRREWATLSNEVKQHEDPAALIGERDPESAESSSERQRFLDRHGLAFHQRLADLLYRPTFSTSFAPLPRLVAEYGRGQQKQVEQLHVDLKAPKDRLPRVTHVDAQLVIVGLGNATTHPLTRHSIGQVVLDPLLQRLIEMDGKVRARLRAIRDGLEQNRTEAVQSGRVDTTKRPDWSTSVPTTLSIPTSFTSCAATPQELDLDQSCLDLPRQLTKVNGKSGGWSCTLPLLIPSSPATFFSSHPSDSTIFSVNLCLFKPSHAMNLSGVGLKAFLQTRHPYFASTSHSTPSEHASTGTWNTDDILVLQDELDLDFGSVKRKDAGSARGHNGVRDIVARLDIPAVSSTTCASTKRTASNGAEASGPKLTRLRIGIGRPSHFTPKDIWLPASLQSKKAPRVDRWVLSPLTPAELESCRNASQRHDSVIDHVETLTLQWVAERCASLAQHSQVTKDVGSRKDQFGVFRTVWVQ